VSVPDVSYARSGDVYIAYQVVGEGSTDLVLLPFLSNLYTLWQAPHFAEFALRLAQSRRLIIVNARGVGLSDRPRGFTIESRMDDLRAVMDAVGSERPALLGIAEVSGDEGPLRAALESEAEKLRSFGVSPELVLRTGEPIREILHQTTSAQYDLTIIGAERKGTTGLYWRAEKSYEVIKAIPSPVLLATGACESLRSFLVCTGGKDYIDAAVQLTGKVAAAVSASAAGVLPSANSALSSVRDCPASAVRRPPGDVDRTVGRHPDEPPTGDRLDIEDQPQASFAPGQRLGVGKARLPSGVTEPTPHDDTPRRAAVGTDLIDLERRRSLVAREQRGG